MLTLADRLDALNRWTGRTVRWLALAMVLVQFVIVLMRYLFGISYIFASESVLYMHAALFMLGAGYTLLVDGHVRVDIFYARWSPRRRARLDAAGAVLLLLPSMLLLAWVTWPFVRNSWAILEGPLSVGGIPASFLLKTMIPLFCALLVVQALAGLARDLVRLREREAP
jgi:TRAP-type mannitol/chloroaromatic compound transport system permease small subunit